MDKVLARKSVQGSIFDRCARSEKTRVMAILAAAIAIVFLAFGVWGMSSAFSWNLSLSDFGKTEATDSTTPAVNFAQLSR